MKKQTRSDIEAAHAALATVIYRLVPVVADAPLATTQERAKAAILVDALDKAGKSYDNLGAVLGFPQ